MKLCEFLKYTDQDGKVITPECIRQQSPFKGVNLCVACLVNLVLIELQRRK